MEFDEFDYEYPPEIPLSMKVSFEECFILMNNEIPFYDNNDGTVSFFMDEDFFEAKELLGREDA